MKKTIIIAILVSNISYGANTRPIPTSAKCYEINGDFRSIDIVHCEMSNGDICYRDEVHKALSCFKK